MTEFLYMLFTFLPFMVCLVWLAVFTADFRKSSRPRRAMTFFALACSMLYFCHAWFFMPESGDSRLVNAVYLFCNLSVYPLFYRYIAILTRDEPFRWKGVLILLPALLFSVLGYITRENATVIEIAKIVFAVEVVLVAVFGLRDLSSFDKSIRGYYSDTEGKTMNGTRVVLICMVLTSLLSIIFNLIGRTRFLGSLLIAIPSIAFSAMLFSIFYGSSRIGFWSRDFNEEIKNDDTIASGSPAQEEGQLEARISAVMAEQKLFLQPGLKISDVAAAVGSNRTYVSNAINNAGGVSFADYVNIRRIEYAKDLLTGSREEDVAITDVAAECGFASFTSFYRAFVKFERKSPSQWLKERKG